MAAYLNSPLGPLQDLFKNQVSHLRALEHTISFETLMRLDMAELLTSRFFGYLLHRPDQGQKGVHLEPQLFEYSR